MEKNIVTPTPNDLENMNARIRELKMQAENSESKASEAYEKQVRALEDKFNLYKAKLNRLSRQAEGASDEFSKGISKAWQELKTSVDEAKKYIH